MCFLSFKTFLATIIKHSDIIHSIQIIYEETKVILDYVNDIFNKYFTEMLNLLLVQDQLII